MTVLYKFYPRDGAVTNACDGMTLAEDGAPFYMDQSLLSYYAWVDREENYRYFLYMY